MAARATRGLTNYFKSCKGQLLPTSIHSVLRLLDFEPGSDLLNPYCLVLCMPPKSSSFQSSECFYLGISLPALCHSRITGEYFHPFQFFSEDATYLEQIQGDFTFTSLLIFTVKWYSSPCASPYPNMLSLNGSHSGLLAGGGSSAARRPSPTNSPESFLDEISLAEHLTALAGSQCGCSWMVAPVPKSRGSALRNVDSLEDVPIFSDSKDMVLRLVTRGPLLFIPGQPLSPGNTQGELGSETRTGCLV